jgi:excisionase family DNA binding protein
MEATIGRDRLLLKREALRALRISLPTLDRMIARGDLPVVKLSGRSLRIRASALRDFISQRTERRGA